MLWLRWIEEYRNAAKWERVGKYCGMPWNGWQQRRRLPRKK